MPEELWEFTMMLEVQNLVKAYEYNRLPWAIVISNPDALSLSEH